MLGRWARWDFVLVIVLAFAVADPASAQTATEADKLDAEVVRLYQAGKYADAIPIAQRALLLREQALGLDHPNVAIALNNLARLYGDQGHYAEAEPLYKRALAISEQALGPDHPNVATALNNLAALYWAQGRYGEAEPLYQRTITSLEKALGPDHPAVAIALNNLAELYQSQGRYAEAEPLYQRTIMILEKALGSDHPNVAAALNNLARLYFAQSDWVRAADLWRRGTNVSVRRAQRDTNDLGHTLTGRKKGETEQQSANFRFLVKAVYRLASQGPAADAGLASEMFQTAQWAAVSEAAASLSQMAARQAKGGGALAGLVRERQDLVGEWQTRDKLLTTARSQRADKRNAGAETALADRLSAIDARMAEIDRTLIRDFPDYATLASPQPLAVAEVQALLSGDEAVLLFLDTPEWQPAPDESFIWVVTRTEFRWLRSDLGTRALTERIVALRCGLDATLWDEGLARGSAETCKAALGAVPRTESVKVGDKSETVKVLPFDLARAHDLYQALLGPAEDLIKGKRLIIVPSGPLTSLPLNVLVTEPPTSAIPSQLADYRGVAWLGARTAITVLPAVASLKALRQFARTSHAAKPYLGIGNPLLDGPQDDPQWGAYYKQQAQLARDRQHCSESVSQRFAAAVARPLATFAGLFRGPQTDIEEVRQWAPLPETTDELCAVSRRLGVPESEILLGTDATETKLKALSEQGRLVDYAILHFATHGALTGEVTGSAEPGLILTPPPAGTTDPQALERDDGFLTASEIATLKLDADSVGPGARVLLCRGPHPARVALGGGLGRGRPAHDAGLRRTQGEPQNGARRGLAAIDERADREGFARASSSRPMGAVHGGRRRRALEWD
jgi:tetratricopeptide (TPR) repeat protein